METGGKDSFEPGAARYGNFINYYSFNSAEQRIKAVPKTLLNDLCLVDQEVLCLDIGCNKGDLTLALHRHLKGETAQLFFIGIDLDETLIQRCKENNSNEDITFQCVDIMNENSCSILKMYLEKYKKKRFDLITCFSTTMWIHLNHGDDGLKQFLIKISEHAGFLLLEPQEWRCYKSAFRRNKRLKTLFFDLNDIKIRNVLDQINSTMYNCGMEQVKCFGHTSWDRKLYLFKKM